jgi:ABC-2 type transport system permease protein
MLLRTLRDYGFHSIEMLLVVTMAFMLSTVFRSSLLSVGITMFITFAGQVVTALLIRYSWGKYWLFANTDFSVYSAGRAPVEGMTPAFSVAVLAVYYILFIALAWIIFNKRDVAV